MGLVFNAVIIYSVFLPQDFNVVSEKHCQHI